MKYKEGEILIGAKKGWHEAYHPIVFLKEHDGPYFIGLMLTKDGKLKDNIKMLPEHFENGFIYNNTHVVDAFLLKRQEWGPFKTIGNLTISGLEFISKNIKTDNPKFWEDYVRSFNQ